MQYPAQQFQHSGTACTSEWHVKKSHFCPNMREPNVVNHPTHTHNFVIQWLCIILNLSFNFLYRYMFASVTEAEYPTSECCRKPSCGIDTFWSCNCLKLCCHKWISKYCSLTCIQLMTFTFQGQGNICQLLIQKKCTPLKYASILQ